MMNSKFYVLFFSILILMSCQDTKTPKVIVRNGITVTLPGFVKEDELAEDAFIEYANRYRNFYIVVMALNIPQDSVWIQTTRRIYSSLESYKIDSFQRGDALITHINGRFKNEDEPIYYTQKLITSLQHQYLLTVWTRGDERYKTHKETIDSILNSFKLAN